VPASYLSPKTQVGENRIEGKGLFARRRIRKDEVVAIKGGHVNDARMLAKVKERVAVSSSRSPTGSSSARSVLPRYGATRCSSITPARPTSASAGRSCSSPCATSGRGKS